MPYCPKCDMEFVDGITVCSDCGGSLMESEEAAKAVKKEQEAQELEAQNRAHEEWKKEMELSATAADEPEEKPSAPTKPTKLYVNKEQKYEDFKSAASAFLFVGVILLSASILCWIGIIKLPMAGATKLIFQTALTVMGVLSLAISLNSSNSAKQLAPQIDNENKNTLELIRWFTESYDGAAIDCAIEDAEALSPEEMSLKRFQVIQDYLITHHDLPDPAYVDALSEEIYSKLYD